LDFHLVPMICLVCVRAFRVIQRGYTFTTSTVYLLVVMQSSNKSTPQHRSVGKWTDAWSSHTFSGPATQTERLFTTTSRSGRISLVSSVASLYIFLRTLDKPHVAIYRSNIPNQYDNMISPILQMLDRFLSPSPPNPDFGNLACFLPYSNGIR
jgi:hypothetical protein